MKRSNCYNLAQSLRVLAKAELPDPVAKNEPSSSVLPAAGQDSFSEQGVPSASAKGIGRVRRRELAPGAAVWPSALTPFSPSQDTGPHCSCVYNPPTQTGC